jgi:hypothetical protein
MANHDLSLFFRIFIMQVSRWTYPPPLRRDLSVFSDPLYIVRKSEEMAYFKRKLEHQHSSVMTHLPKVQ